MSGERRVHPAAALLGRLPLQPGARALIDSLAGTGKTEGLAQLTALLVLEHEVTPGRIVVLSFNEKAAREARARVREVAERLLGAPERAPAPGAPTFEIGPRQRRLLEELLRAPPEVLTIHAWASQLLERHAFAAGLPLRATRTARRASLRAAFLELVRERLAGPERVELEAWLAARDLDRLEALLARCLAEGPTAELRPPVDLDAARERLRALAAFRGGQWGRLRSAAQDAGLHWQTARKLRDLLPELRERVAALAASGARLTAHDPRLAAELEYLRAYLPRLVRGAEDEAFRAAVDDLVRAQVGLDAAAAHLWLGPLRARYAALKRRAGALDFDDLLVLLDEALSGPRGAALKEAIRARCDVLVVDEVQDANALIYGYPGPDGAARGLFRPLFVDAAFGGRVYACGDPHQAIYGWRGADVHGGFLRARRDLPVRRLTASFRSTPALIEAMNVLFAQDAPEPLFRGEIRYEEPAAAGRPTLRAAANGAEVAPVGLLEVEPRGERLGADELRAAVAQAIAREVDRLRAAPITLLEEGRPARPLGLDEVFVLTRTNREARQVADVLRAFQPPIPCVLHRAGGLFASAEAEDLAALLAALARPERRDLRLRALATPLFGVPFEALGSARALPAGHPLALRLAAWTQQAERDLPGFLARLPDSAALPARAALGGLPGGRRVGVYRQVLEALQDRATRAPGGAGDLLANLEALRAEAEAAAGEDDHPIRQESEAPAVKVMTIFAAKGLGAGVVFLTGGYTARDEDDAVVVYTEPGEAVASESHASDGAEERRARAGRLSPEAPPSGSGAEEPREPRYEDPQAPPRAAVYHDPSGRRILHVGPLDAEASALHAATQREQDTFLLYTAITRAVARVVLPYVPWDAREGRWSYPRLAGSFYEPLNLRLRTLVGAREHDPALAARFAHERVRRDPRAGAATGSGDLAALATWRPSPALAEALAADARALDARRALVARHRARRVVSYSSLKRAEVASAALAAEPLEAAPGEEGAPALGTDLLPGGREVGNLVHAILEQVDLARVGAAEGAASWGALPEVRALLEAEGARYGLAAAQLEVVRDLVYRTLTRELDLGGLRLPGLWRATCRREVDFRVPLPGAAPGGGAAGLDGSGEGPRLERGALVGALDALVRWTPPGGPPLLLGLDWKSDALEDYAPAALEARVAQDYAIQRAAYSYVVARLAGARRPEDLAALDVRLGYVFVRATGAPGGGPAHGLRVTRVDPAAFARAERFLQEVGA